MSETKENSVEMKDIFRRFTEAAGQGFGIATLDGKIYYANPALLKLVGEDNLADIQGKPFNSYYTEEFQEIILKEAIPSVMQFGQWEGQTQMISKFGRRFFVSESFFLIRDESGEALFLADVITDISETIQSEEQFQKSFNEAARSHRLLLALSQAAQSVLRAKTIGDIFDCIGNELTNLDYGSMIFRISDEREYFKIVHTTYAKNIMRTAEKLVGISAIGHSIPIREDNKYGQLVKNGNAVFQENAGEAFRQALPAGTRPIARQVARMLGIEQSIFAPLNVAGDLYGFLLVTGKNMTEEDCVQVCAFADQAAIALENALLNEQMKLRADELEKKVHERTAELAMSAEILAGISDAIISADTNFVIQGWNDSAETIYGWRAEEVIGKPYVEVLKPDYIDLTREQVLAEFAKTGSFDGEVIHHCKDGSAIYVHGKANEIKNDLGETVAVVSINRDITHRVKAEKELAQRMTELERFNRLAVGREQRMIELKLKVNQLLRELDREPEFQMRYLDDRAFKKLHEVE